MYTTQVYVGVLENDNSLALKGVISPYRYELNLEKVTKKMNLTSEHNLVM